MKTGSRLHCAAKTNFNAAMESSSALLRNMFATVFLAAQMDPVSFPYHLFSFPLKPDFSLDESQLCFKSVGCSSEEFQCVSSGKCISRLWVCYRDKDCTDGSDEIADMCNSSTCEIGKQFQRNNTRQCIPASWECDGDLDCGEGDSSDEHAGETMN